MRGTKLYQVPLDDACVNDNTTFLTHRARRKHGTTIYQDHGNICAHLKWKFRIERQCGLVQGGEPIFEVAVCALHISIIDKPSFVL